MSQVPFNVVSIFLAVFAFFGGAALQSFPVFFYSLLGAFIVLGVGRISRDD